jgi:Asp/Glu/hydantoin racemase
MRVLLVMNGSPSRYAGGADAARLRAWRPYCRPDTTLEVGYLPDDTDGAGAVTTYEFGTGRAVRDHASLYPGRCELAEQEGYDAVIMHCCSDPGLEEARRRVSIPVIGPGEATLRAGAMLGRAIGMTVPGDESIAHHQKQVEDLGLTDRVVGLEPINRPIGAYGKQDPAAMTDALTDAAVRLAERGADVICPTGLAFIPTRVSAREVSRRIGLPVLNPALLAVRAAETLVEARAAAR